MLSEQELQDMYEEAAGADDALHLEDDREVASYARHSLARLAENTRALIAEVRRMKLVVDAARVACAGERKSHVMTALAYAIEAHDAG